jgi:hypothetical protein
MFIATLVRLLHERATWLGRDRVSAVLLRADETYRVLPPLPLSDLKRLIGREVTLIDICGTEPTKPTVLIAAQEGEGPKRLNRRATILLRGVPAKNRDAVFGDVVVTQILNPKGCVIHRAAKADPEPRARKLEGSREKPATS